MRAHFQSSTEPEVGAKVLVADVIAVHQVGQLLLELFGMFFPVVLLVMQLSELAGLKVSLQISSSTYLSVLFHGATVSPFSAFVM